MNGVKLRQLLWESADLWQKQVEEWSTVDLNQLIPENINRITAKIEKDIHLFETNLPPNLIVPKLHENIKIMKEKVNIVLTAQVYCSRHHSVTYCCCQDKKSTKCKH
jgi:nitrogen-specific signal transduction histidine kinase